MLDRGGEVSGLAIHEAAALFPEMDSKRYGELVESIRENGLRLPIVLCGGEILDGRNRYKACVETQTTPKFTEFDGDPWAFAWDANGQRRDLSADQRYLIWKAAGEKSEAWQARQQAIRDEGNTKRAEATKAQPRTEDGTKLAPGNRTNSAATSHSDKGREAKADASGTNRGSVERMDSLERKRPDLAAEVMAGTKKPTAALREMRKGEIPEKVAALPEGKFRVIYADPPWKYNDERSLGAGDSAQGGVDRATTAATHHYPPMSMDELSALDVKELAADDCVLFCWVTFPLLPGALGVIKSWGFKYKTGFVWDKKRGSFGHYHKAEAELCLVATRGSCTPDAEKKASQIFTAERGRHSAKPECFRTTIDRLYLHGPRIELFRRGPCPEGWVVWGNEAA